MDSKFIKIAGAALLCCVLASIALPAQVHIQGIPLTIQNPVDLRNFNNSYVLPTFDNGVLQTYADSIAGTLDCKTCKNNFYGKGTDVSIDIKTAGRLEVQPDGSKLWLLRINSPSAFGMQFYFSKFKLPFGATLYFYNEEKTMVLGAFTSDNNNPDATKEIQFGTQWITGKTIFIEYYEPFYAEFEGELVLNDIIHIFRDVFFKSGPFASGNIGPCHKNVACPEGAGWEKEIKAVALILYYDSSNKLSAQCTGTLINNTENDGRPYFLTASHCLRVPANNPKHDYSTWLFLFNHQSVTCNSDGSEVGVNTTQSVYGSQLLANEDYLNPVSDYALLELNTSEHVLSGYGVCYAGWDRSGFPGNPPFVGLHHPRGDIKKISIENNPVLSTALSSTVANSNANAWQVSDWDVGVTDNGSSGSPLFNSNHRIIGQLCCGFSKCVGSNSDNGQPDWYGKFSSSWNFGGFSYWLNPFSKAVYSLDSYCPVSCFDGIQNGDETGVDCGGLSCPPCNLTSGGSICRTVQFTVNNKNTTSKIINVCDPNVVLTPYSYNEPSCSGITAAAHWQHITTTRDTWCKNIDDRGEAALLLTSWFGQKCYCKFYKLFIGIQECDENKNLIGSGASHWFNIFDSDQNNDWDALNFYSFHLYDHLPGGFSLQGGKYYAIKIASYGGGVVNASNWKEYTSFIRVYTDNLLIQNKTITKHQFANFITIENSTVPATANIKVVAKTRIEILPNSTLESGAYYIDNFDCNSLDQFSQ